MKEFIEVARDVFAFLESDYGFSIEDRSENSVSWQIIYININREIGIKLLYEVPSSFLFVFICRLVNGELCDNILPITNESAINCFDFNDVLPADQRMKPAYEYGDNSEYYDAEYGLRNYLADFALRLEKYGKQVLLGDSSVFADVEEVIKARARKFKQERR